MVSLDFLKKHMAAGTHLKTFLITGAMLEGKVVAADETSFVLNECLIFIDKVASISPPVKGVQRR